MDATVHGGDPGMRGTAPRREPRMRDVVVEQIRIAALAMRPVALVLGVVMAIVTLLVIIDLATGRAKSWFDSKEWVPLALVAFVYPFAVWRRDRRFGPGFLWTLPVDRRRLALAKVFAGWVWLAGALLVVMIWEHVLALVVGVRDPETVPLVAFIGVTAAYAFGSAVMLGFRHPLRLVAGAVGVVFLTGTVGDALRLDPDRLPGADVFFARIEGTLAAWEALPDLLQWSISTLLFVGAGLAALLAAVSRHGERRRR